VPARAATAVAVLAMMALGLVTLLLVALDTGLGGLAIGLVLALIPLPIYLVLALWIDRYEKEPITMLALAFLWGGTVAVFFSYVLNSLIGGIFLAIGGKSAAQIGPPILTAPFVEEIAKGVALFLLYFFKRDEFDNVTDGIVYAAMVGLGFATCENVLYYGAAAQEGIQGPVVAFFMRGVISPYSHPLFTAMTGIGLGIAREARGGAVRWAAPVAGLTLAMALHSLWNLSAALGLAFFFTYLFIMLPFFLGVLALVAWSLGRERAILRSHLTPYMTAGWLTREELERLSSQRLRMRERLAALRAEGLGGWRRSGAFHRAATELAFHRWRHSRGIGRGAEAYATRERATLDRVRAFRGRARPPVVRPPNRSG